MKVQIGRDYIVIDGRLFDIRSYRDANVYGILTVINDLDRSRFPDDLSEDRDDEVTTNEDIFLTPYGCTIAKILDAYFNLTTKGIDDEDYRTWANIKNMIEEKLND